MLTNLFGLIVAIFFVCGKASVDQCQEVFKYDVKNDKIKGHLDFMIPSNQRYLNLSVKLLVYSRVFDGSLKIINNIIDVEHVLENGGNLNYSILFYSKNFTPLIQSITLNDDIICKSSSEEDVLKKRKHNYFVHMNHYTYFNEDGVLSHFSEISSRNLDARKHNQRPKGRSSHNSSSISTTFDRRHIKRSLPENCGITERISNTLILGGQSAKVGEWPWLAAIYFKSDWDIYFKCPATLISDSHIITVGYCVISKKKIIDPSELLLKLGVYDIREWIDTNVIHRDARSVHLHPEYTEKLENNLAIVAFNPVKFTASLSPVCLWDNDVDLDNIVQKLGTIVGWGMDEDGDISPEANQIDTPVVSREKCFNTKAGTILSRNTFCAGAKDGTGPCSNDGGDGFFMFYKGRWRIRGMVSLTLVGEKKCDLYEYIIFIDVARYKDWIEEVIS